jgi:hypothetical protein
VLEKGGIGRSNPEDADEQLILALEFLSFHANSCMPNDPIVPSSADSDRFRYSFAAIGGDQHLDLFDASLQSALQDDQRLHS